MSQVSSVPRMGLAQVNDTSYVSINLLLTCSCLSLMFCIQFYSEGVDSLMEKMVEAMCLHVADDSPTVRRLCLRGLVQVLIFFHT